MPSQRKNVFWFRRDLRLDDNTGLIEALAAENPVLPLFIFDTNILNKLENKEDARVTFIYDAVCSLHKEITSKGSNLLIKIGKPEEIFRLLNEIFSIEAVFTNRDYEPYAKERDNDVGEFLKSEGIQFHVFKDQVIFEGQEILSKSGNAYKVFTPYSKVWLSRLEERSLQSPTLPGQNFIKLDENLEPPGLSSLGFERSKRSFTSKKIPRDILRNYDKTRDFPFMEGTSRLGVHLRFGTISIRKVVQEALSLNATFLNELIWREFYMMILDQNPHVVENSFKPQYDKIPWKNNEDDFLKWCKGQTGIPMVDAGMRQLNNSGYMHNRVRMITASFLTKNLLIDWRWGEAYFADKLLDYELSSNNGGWQWAAGSGVDAQPYFRVFNPETQRKSWDPEEKYIRKWIPEYGTPEYPQPMVDLKASRAYAIATFKKHLNA